MNRAKSYPKLAILTTILAVIWLLAGKSQASVLAGWDTHTNTLFGPSPYTATVANANLTVGGLTRGQGVSTSGTAAAGGWGGLNWTNVDEATAIASNKFLTFAIAANSGYTVSFSTVTPFNYRRSGTGANAGELQYQIGSGSFIDAASISYSSSSSSGASVSAIDLSGISDLQNVSAGTVVTFRIVNYGGTSTSGTWYIYETTTTSGDDFEIQGAVNPVASGAPPGNVVVTPSSVVTNANATVAFNVSATGDAPTYSWYKETPAGTNLIGGATTSTLTLPNLTALDTANYQVVLANANGSATSSVVSLTVNDPGITAQPVNMTNVLNDVDYFTATAVGSQPTEAYWYYNGTLLTNSPFVEYTNSLTVAVLNSTDATNLNGYYFVASNQFGMVTSLVATATIAVTPSVELTRWDFNDTNASTPTSTLASIGTGIGTPGPNAAVTNFAFAAGSLFDPVQLLADETNEGWALNGFATTISNKTAGFQFNTSTLGYKNIYLTWSERHSATASKYMRVQYSTNGVDFIDGDVVTFNQVAYQFYSSDLSAKPGVANNPNFAFRIVAEWEGTAINTSSTNYDATSAGSTFGSGGTIRLDLMTVFGDSVGSVVSPIPLSIQRIGTKVVLTWNDPSSAFSLQAAPLATGIYDTVSGATSPYTNAITGVQQYFRLKSN